MRAGLIGCGRIGLQRHIQAFSESNSRLVGVCDTVLHKAKDAAKQYLQLTGKSVRIFNDYKEMLKSVDWVSIATESGYHFPIAMEVLSQGKHLLIEKPMTLLLDDADQLIHKASNSNLIVGVCYQNRFNIAIKELLRKVDEQAFGKIFRITARILWNRDENYYKQASWRGTKLLDGGMLFNQCSHTIDLLQRIANSFPQKIFAVKENFSHKYIETEDTAVAIIHFENGIIGIVEASSNTYPKNLENSISVFGEKGTVVVGGTALNEVQTWSFENDKTDLSQLKQVQTDNNVYGRGHIELFKNFETAISNGSQPEVNAAEGKKSIVLIQGIIDSDYNLRS